MRVSYGGRSILLTGDLDPRVERELTEQGLMEPADVLKIPHHGSRRSAGHALLQKVHPSLAIITAGYENSYGHPHPEVLERLASMRATPFRTDIWGMVCVRTDGRRIELDAFRWQADRRTQSLRRF